jgi:hypothetical protein
MSYPQSTSSNPKSLIQPRVRWLTVIGILAAAVYGGFQFTAFSRNILLNSHAGIQQIDNTQEHTTLELSKAFDAVTRSGATKKGEFFMSTITTKDATWIYNKD